MDDVIWNGSDYSDNSFPYIYASIIPPMTTMYICLKKCTVSHTQKKNQHIYNLIHNLKHFTIKLLLSPFLNWFEFCVLKTAYCVVLCWVCLAAWEPLIRMCLDLTAFPIMNCNYTGCKHKFKWLWNCSNICYTINLINWIFSGVFIIMYQWTEMFFTNLVTLDWKQSPNPQHLSEEREKEMESDDTNLFASRCLSHQESQNNYSGLHGVNSRMLFPWRMLSSSVSHTQKEDGFSPGAALLRSANANKQKWHYVACPGTKKKCHLFLTGLQVCAFLSLSFIRLGWLPCVTDKLYHDTFSKVSECIFGMWCL